LSSWEKNWNCLSKIIENVKPPTYLNFQCSYCVVCLKNVVNSLSKVLQIHVFLQYSAGQSLYMKVITSE
jgi:hypothetical protein